jgi:hypothetical protein
MARVEEFGPADADPPRRPLRPACAVHARVYSGTVGGPGGAPTWLPAPSRRSGPPPNVSCGTTTCTRSCGEALRAGVDVAPLVVPPVTRPREPPPAPGALPPRGPEDRLLDGLPAAHAATSSRWNGIPATSVTSLTRPLCATCQVTDVATALKPLVERHEHRPRRELACDAAERDAWVCSTLT